MMNKPFFKRVMSVTLAFCAAFSSAACSGGATESAKFVDELPQYEATRALDIDAWLGPKTADHALKDFADCGYNLYHLQQANFSTTGKLTSDEECNEWLDRIFQKSKEYGLRVIIAPHAVNTSATSIIPFEYTYGRVGKTLEKWKNDDTFYGFMPTDETTWDKPLLGPSNAEVSNKRDNEALLMRDYERSIDFILDDYLYFSSKFPGKYFETTLLGTPFDVNSPMSYFMNGRVDYDEYLDVYYNDFLKYVATDERVYSFDAYPFYMSGETLCYRTRFLETLAIIADKAEAVGAKKAVYIQNEDSIINGEVIDYQYFTAMAYGYTHFTTYCYSDEWGEDQFSTTNGGVKTANYYYFRRAHQKVKSMEAVYTNFCDRRIATKAFAGTKQDDHMWRTTTGMGESLPAVNGVNCEYDLLMSAFTDESGNYGYMLANQMKPDSLKTNALEIKFNGATGFAVWADGKELEIIDASDGTLKITLASGGGAFVIPMKK